MLTQAVLAYVVIILLHIPRSFFRHCGFLLFLSIPGITAGLPGFVAGDDIGKYPPGD